MAKMLLMDVGFRLSKAMDPYEVLLDIEDLRDYVHHGFLQKDVKKLLSSISADRLQDYFMKDEGTPTLLSKICKGGIYSEVLYAIDKLHLDELESFPGRFDKIGAPDYLLTAIQSPASNAFVVELILSKGVAVTPRAFSAWAMCPAPERHLAEVLRVLHKHNKQDVPPLESTFPVLNKIGKSPHLKVLRKVFGEFTRDQFRFAARHGLTYLLLRMAAIETYISNDFLADLFEMCEVARIPNTNKKSRTLPLFRWSLRLRKNAAKKAPITHGPWAKFSTPEDIDRVEGQIADNDFTEFSWQMLMTAAKFRMSPSKITPHATKGSRTFEQLLEVKNYVLTNERFHGDPTSFLVSVAERCGSILLSACEPRLALLPTFYDCLEEIFRCDAASESIVNSLVSFFGRLSAQPMEPAQFEEVRRRKDEVLFLAGYSLSKPNKIGGRSRTQQLVTPIIDRLLKMGAALGVAPGQKMSTLRYALQGKDKLYPHLKNVLRLNVCCRMDLSKRELKLLDLPLKRSSPPALKCLAAAQCTKLSSETIQDYLAYELDVGVAYHLRLNIN